MQGPLPDHIQQRLPPHLDTLVAFVRRAWAPPAPTRPLSLQDLAAGACISAGYLSEVATVGAGVRLGELYEAPAEHGLTILGGCGPSAASTA